MRWWMAAFGLLIATSCSEDGGGTATGSAGSGSGSAAAKPATGSSKGFGADLLRELDGSGSSAKGSGDGSAAAAGSAAKPGDGSATAAGSAAKPGDGSATAAGSAAKPGDGSAMAAGSAAKPGDGSAMAAGSAAKPGAGAMAAGSAAKPGDGSATKPVPVAAGSGAGSAKPSTGPTQTGSATTTTGADPAPKGPVRVPAELAAIKLSLLPNWERDVDEAGTISLAVKVQGRPQPVVFRFRYGFEDAKAPADRDAYKKWLADNKLLSVRQDRQAGAAWFIEGNDGSGNPAFRIVVNFGGRKLICYGSLYKDAESSRLNDLRDQTIIQAKQICETVAL